MPPKGPHWIEHESGKFLHFSGQLLTDKKGERWRDVHARAEKMIAATPVAGQFKIVPAT